MFADKSGDMAGLEAGDLQDFTIILKNARSLTSDEHLLELIAELAGTSWDAFC